MGIEIVLYDSSPIVQKIFFHILYHYSPIVHRIDETSALIEKIQYSKPDIIFIDAAFSKNNNLINKINEKKEELKKIPIILMSKTDLDPRELESIFAQDILKKPIEAESLRQLITRFVSKTKSNILTKHLEFPSIPNFIENQDKKETLSPKEQKKTTKNGDIEIATDIEELEPPKEQSPPKEEKTSMENDGINLVTDTEELEPPKEQSPPKEQKASTDTGINLVTDTKEVQLESKTPSPKEESPPKEEKASTETGINIKPVTAVTEKKEDTEVVNEPLIKKPVSKEETKPIIEAQKPHEIEKQQEAEEFKQPDTPEEQQQEAEEFKQLDTPEEQSSTEPVKEEHTITESDLNIQMKSKVDDYIKTIGEEILKVKVEEISEQKIQKEIDKKIKDYQDTILKTIEKSVWQVVPELARQLIIKEIDRLLKEEDTK